MIRSFFCHSPGSERRFSKLKSTWIHLEDEDESCTEDESWTGDESWVHGFLIKYLSIILTKE